jgi:hypothetical protein
VSTWGIPLITFNGENPDAESVPSQQTRSNDWVQNDITDSANSLAASSAEDNLLHPTLSHTGSLGGWKIHIDHLLSQNLEPILTGAHPHLRQKLSSVLKRSEKSLKDDFEKEHATYISPELLMKQLIREFWNDAQFWYVDDQHPSDLAQIAQQTHGDLSRKLESLRLFAEKRADERKDLDPDREEEKMQVMVRGVIGLYEFWRNAFLQASSPPRPHSWQIHRGTPVGGERSRMVFSGTIARLQDRSQCRHLALSLLDKVFLTWLEDRGFSEEEEE